MNSFGNVTVDVVAVATLLALAAFLYPTLLDGSVAKTLSAVAIPLVAVALPPLFAGEFLLGFVAVRLPSLAQSAVSFLPLAVSAQPPVAPLVAVPLPVAVPLASAFLPLFYYAQNVIVVPPLAGVFLPLFSLALVLVLLLPLLILVLSPLSKLEIIFSFELSQNSK